MRLSLFSNTLDRDPEMIEGSWLEFIDQMANFALDHRPATEAEKKHNTPLISPATYCKGTTRLNANVQSFGSWFALDIDDSEFGVDAMKTWLEAYPTDYLIYTTTKSTRAAERYRACFPLDRDVTADEARKFWRGTRAFFGNVSDPQTKDPARIFYVPANWEGSDPRFEFRALGDVVSVDELLEAAPAEPELVPMVYDPAVERRIGRVLLGQGKSLSGPQSIFNSPVVSSHFVDDYLATPKGAHHGALYKFMARIAGRAISKGYAICPSDLSMFARQLDSVSMVKTNRQRWPRIEKEAQTALAWALTHFSKKETDVIT